jgi:hypothetical protein
MKQFILIIVLVVLASIATTPKAQAMFGHVAAEKQRRISVEQQLGQLGQQLSLEKQTTDKWQGVSFTLGIGCVVTLVVGTAIGSNGRKHANPSQ